MTEPTTSSDNPRSVSDWDVPPDEWSGPEAPDPRFPEPPRVLLVYNRVLSTFIAGDLRILRRFARARGFCWRGPRSYGALKRATAECDLVYCWFAGRHALAAEIAAPKRVPVIVVVGGYEAADVPELSYGNARNRLIAMLPRAVLKRADAIVSVSRSSRDETTANLRVSPSRLTLIPNAIDTTRYAPSIAVGKREGVLTIAVLNRESLVRKGIDLFAACAARMPEKSFTVAGPANDDVAREWVKSLPENVAYTGKVSPEEKYKLLRSASVYFQGSRHEAFGVAVAEAMASGCIPAAADATALPEVVGDAGFLFDRTDESAAVAAIESALAAPDTMRVKARERIVELYDVSIRQERLAALIADTLTMHRSQ